MAIVLVAEPSIGLEHAGPDARARVEQVFNLADADGSGALSSKEFEEANLGLYGVSFKTFDANDDGRTTLAEYLALFERHHPSEHQPEL